MRTKKRLVSQEEKRNDEKENKIIRKGQKKHTDVPESMHKPQVDDRG